MTTAYERGWAVNALRSSPDKGQYCLNVIGTDGLPNPGNIMYVGTSSESYGHIVAIWHPAGRKRLKQWMHKHPTAVRQLLETYERQQAFNTTKAEAVCCG